ncbi:MAG: hypothetical protein K2M82_04675 [Lachnospiraceae bacterium]|nr:hypothetical protein [Lachnospiraceae bacterium]
MVNEKKKPESEIPEEKMTEPPNAENAEKPSGKPQAEGKKMPDESQKPAEGETKPETALPELSEEDKLKEENFRLKAQLEAMKIGFNPDVIEDAVVLAENIVKKDGSDIASALQAVAKKYPDWKADSKGEDSKKKGGFKVGADGSKQTTANDDKLNAAFGIKKKG